MKQQLHIVSIHTCEIIATCEDYRVLFIIVDYRVLVIILDNKVKLNDAFAK